MSEYWVSKGKYWCKYCNQFIADDAPSRKHHETGGKHKGNLERYIRGIYKKSAKTEKDKAEEERVMRQIDSAAAASMGVAPDASTSSIRPVAQPKKASGAAKSNDKFANYTTAESLGFVDTDAYLARQERELRDKEGIAGQWTIVSNSNKGKQREVFAEEEGEPAVSEEQQRRRDHDDPSTKRISFGYLKERSLPDADDDDYSKLEIKVKDPAERRQKDLLEKAKAQARSQAPPNSVKPSSANNAGKSMFKPVQAGEEVEETEEESQARQQAAWDLIAPPEEEEVKPQIEAAAPMFKKRKAGAGSSSAAKRRA